MGNKPNWQKLKDGDLSWSTFKYRAKILHEIRKYFYRQGFLEIEAPTLTPYPTLDNNITSIKSKIKTPNGQIHKCYLHTSPEHAMKKLLAAGSGPIFFLGKVFRDNELTKLHNPEYTMAEWYQIHADYHDIMRDTQNLICTIAKRIFKKMNFVYQNQTVNLEPPWPVLSILKLFKMHFGISSVEMLDKESLRLIANKYGVHYAVDDDWETLYHRLFMERIEPTLGHSKPVFIIDYPIQIGLMARRKSGNDHFVERVELYIAGLELANGYSELTEPNEQIARFQKQQNHLSNINHNRIDDELIHALHLGIPPCAGIALGVDRLLMFFLNKSEIREVLLFPFS